jgi:aldose 1-epimerase
MNVRTSDFGKLPDGRIAKQFCFESSNGLITSITNYGANITSILMPDKDGRKAEITAGFTDLESYIKGHPHFGIVAGRFANRIAKGRFKIGSHEYKLALNNGENHLHGGPEGFHVKLWDWSLEENENSVNLILKYLSPDMEEGYPGNLMTTITYTMTDNNDIIIKYEATTDKPTHVNLTNHTYFNLGGFANLIYDHYLTVDSAYFLELDDTQIPTGKKLSCQSHSLDLRSGAKLLDAIKAFNGGIDNCFILEDNRDYKKPVAILSHPESGRILSVFTTQPSVQIYTGNSLDGTLTGHNNTVYEKHSAICLETQHYPDTPNHPDFPTTLLNPEEKYDFEAKFVFETK